MGYLYTSGGALVCDMCGTGQGARLRRCPHRAGGLPYCKPNALCDACLARIGGAAVLHAACAEPARQAQAEHDRRQAALAAGELFVHFAIGGPGRHAGRDIARGMVLAGFRGQDGREVLAVMPAADYDPRAKPALSDYPALQAAEGGP